jgi:hypothetical protein
MRIGGNEFDAAQGEPKDDDLDRWQFAAEIVEAKADEDVLAGALRTALRLRVEKNTKAKKTKRKNGAYRASSSAPSATLPSVPSELQQCVCEQQATLCVSRRSKRPFALCVLPIVLVEPLQSGHGLRLRSFFCRFGCCLRHSGLKLR